jgi:hypothetical protein
MPPCPFSPTSGGVSQAKQEPSPPVLQYAPRVLRTRVPIASTTRRPMLVAWWDAQHAVNRASKAIKKIQRILSHLQLIQTTCPTSVFAEVQTYNNLRHRDYPSPPFPSTRGTRNAESTPPQSAVQGMLDILHYACHLLESCFPPWPCLFASSFRVVGRAVLSNC